jgi:hypothetical protein
MSELPGMWEDADLSGGEADTACTCRPVGSGRTPDRECPKHAARDRASADRHARMAEAIINQAMTEEESS